MTLSEISAAVMARLLSDQGTNDYWNATDIETDTNWLYLDTAESFKCCKKRDYSITTVVDTARYEIPVVDSVSKILAVAKVEYDKEDVPFVTVDELSLIDFRWRSLGSGKPWACTYEAGDENIAITLVPKPSDTKELAFTFSYLPIQLAGSADPVAPFEDGRILIDGLMSMQLSKPGGGRDLDRADWYFSQFVSKCARLTEHKGFGARGYKSIESGYSRRGFAGRLPSNYPPYSF